MFHYQHYQILIVGVSWIRFPILGWIIPCFNFVDVIDTQVILVQYVCVCVCVRVCSRRPKHEAQYGTMPMMQVDEQASGRAQRRAILANSRSQTLWLYDEARFLLYLHAHLAIFTALPLGLQVVEYMVEYEYFSRFRSRSTAVLVGY